MTDLTQYILAQFVAADREREARAIARTAALTGRSQSHGLRASLAAHLARVALRLDREAAGFWLRATNGSSS
jgi:hypothetical protein